MYKMQLNGNVSCDYRNVDVREAARRQADESPGYILHSGARRDGCRELERGVAIADRITESLRGNSQEFSRIPWNLKFNSPLRTEEAHLFATKGPVLPPPLPPPPSSN